MFSVFFLEALLYAEFELPFLKKDSFGAILTTGRSSLLLTIESYVPNGISEY